MSDDAQIVWCVICVEPDAPDDPVTHIFSTREKAERFMATDARAHVLHDYAVDFPERFEGRQQ